MSTETSIASDDTESRSVWTWRHDDNQVLLGHLRRQRPDGGAFEPEANCGDHDAGSDAPPRGPSLAIFDKLALLRQLRLAQSGGDVFDETAMAFAAASSDEQTRLERLRALAGEEPLRHLVVADEDTPERLAKLREECPGFVTVIALIERAVALSAVAGTAIAFPPLLLVGPPGLGKTHFSRRLAAALGVEQHAFSCATNSDAQALLIGHPPTWRGARMGVLTETLLGGDTANPLILLDEVDKFVTHSTEKPYNTLLALLEPENAGAVVDEYLRVPFDLSRCLIVATANDLEALPGFIQDRFLVVAITPPDGAMLRAIASRIAAEIITAHGDTFALPDEAVVARLASTNPRGIRRLVALALGFAAQATRRHLIVADVTAAEDICDAIGAREPIGFMRPRSKEGWSRE
ncbi:AAA family ATPase [Bosea sp. (in: a-proteobacteria)]|uniref:AAA family ATPase n=1 Tax=Bosea sp. (in: a-proteobacteria) TaxID=1871050 RepID=UPI0025C6058C|nr:AAA family ATPase [Bosea sp. (in: a-proteobacteria)]